MTIDVLGHRMPDVPGWREEATDARTVFDPWFVFAAERGYDAPSHIEAMDREGIDRWSSTPRAGCS